MTRRRALLLALLAWAGGGVVASGQRITGVVRDSVGQQPIAGVVVQTVNASGVAGARTITDRGGAFRLDVDRDAHALQVRRIGFYPRDVPLTDAMRAGTITVLLRPIAATLETVVTDGGRGCAPSSTRDQALALWEQARTGFLATVVARDVMPAQVRIARYDQQLADGNIVSHSFSVSVGATSKPFLASLSPAQIAVTGYATRAGTGWAFHPPDADILLDESFRNAHCFTLATGDRAHRDQIGIAFAPPPAGRGDTLVDISGTLWLDRAPLALRSLDFAFERLRPRDASRKAGGGIIFRTADNGIVVIERWEGRFLAMPAGPVRVRPAADTAAPPSGDGSQMRIVGGELLSAKWPDGASIVRPFPTIDGKVVERGTKRPLEGITVEIPGTPYKTITTADGGFSFDEALPGSYAVNAEDESWKALGLGRWVQNTLVVREGRPARMTIEMEPLDRAVARGCNADKLEKDRSAIAGRVVDMNGKGTPASVQVSWLWNDPINADGASVRTTPFGAFFVCNLPPGLNVKIEATDARGFSGMAMLKVAPPGIQQVTIRVPR